jgi:hypothetical protein
MQAFAAGMAASVGGMAAATGGMVDAVMMLANATQQMTVQLREIKMIALKANEYRGEANMLEKSRPFREQQFRMPVPEIVNQQYRSERKAASAYDAPAPGPTQTQAPLTQTAPVYRAPAVGPRRTRFVPTSGAEAAANEQEGPKEPADSDAAPPHEDAAKGQEPEQTQAQVLLSPPRSVGQEKEPSENPDAAPVPPEDPPVPAAPVQEALPQP